MDLDEGTLRSLAVSVRPVLRQLVGDPDQAEDIERDLASALAMPLGAAREDLRRILLLRSAAVRAWCQHFLPRQDSSYRTVGTGGPGTSGVRGVGIGEDPGGGVLEDETVRGPRPSVGTPPASDEDPDPGDVDTRALAFSMPALVESGRPAVAGEAYSGQFFVGQHRAGLLATAVMTRDEIGAGGLSTTWTVSSRTIRLDPWTGDGPADPEVTCDTVEAGSDRTYYATFPLHIPAAGDSRVRTLALTPLSAPAGDLQVEIKVGDDVYRTMSATIEVVPPDVFTPPADDPAPTGHAPFVVGEQRLVSAPHAGLTPKEEWQRPARTLRLTVGGGSLRIWDSDDDVDRPVAWRPNMSGLNTAIDQVRMALDKLRDAFPDLLDAPGQGTLDPQLAAYDVEGDWLKPIAGDPGEAPATAPTALVVSPQLRSLATQGRLMFQALFTDQTVRDTIASLQPGDLVHLTWMQEDGQIVPTVPLPLLFLGVVPPAGQPVDITQFLGLRHRIAYQARNPLDKRRSLGEWQETVRGHFLYWGSAAGDDVGTHALRHGTDLARWQPLTLLPANRANPSITEVSGFLGQDGGDPVSVLYFYCHCATPSDGSTYLRFGPTSDPGDVLTVDDVMATGLPISGAPVAFVNACKSSFTETLKANQLMEAFFTRGCRSYIGSEVRVPPGLAANFAMIFFSLLYGGAGTTKSPVGESMSQARRYLWRRYGNPGGLFYSSFNDYLLYAMSDRDVRELRDR